MLAPLATLAPLQAALLTTQEGIEAHEWTNFVALELALRTYTFFFSLVIAMGGVTWLRHGYKAGAFPSYIFSTDAQAYYAFMKASCIMMACETLNFLVMDLYVRRCLSHKGYVLYRLRPILQNSLFLMYFILNLGFDGIDPWRRIIVNATLESGFCE